jgi:GTPase SAR1 family protein
LLWIKIKSIARKELLKEFLEINQITLDSSKVADQFESLFAMLNQDLVHSHNLLDTFIKSKDKENREKIDEEKLVSELYKLKYFDWGGDYKNALDKYLVDRYIKNYDSYDVLQSKIETEISVAVRGYVFCSWYNHWSSILIENIFKTHPLVLPTVGQIKRVDFFVNQIPFDLKVTYLPDNFVALKRKNAGLKTELAELKHMARQENIVFDRRGKDSYVYNEIVEKIKDSRNASGLQTLKNIRDFKLQILRDIEKNPQELIQNLYEEQGEMRFDASNRLFLILVDTEDFANS